MSNIYVNMQKEKLNIVFLEGLEPRHNKFTTYIGFLFPIASVLENENISFKVLSVKNLIDYSLDGIINELMNYSFDAIGMTTNADSIRFVYKVCDTIKNAFPKATIILGGAQATYTDIKTLKECKCDIVIRSEGELKILEILKCLSKNVGYGHIKGITYKQDENIIRNEDSFPPDINSLPVPQYAILTDKKYWIIPRGMPHSQFEEILYKIRKAYPYFMTGRGCPYKCAFCIEGNIKNTYRFRNTLNIKKDLEYYLSLTRNEYIVIADDTFTSSLKRVKELCEIFKEIQVTYPFYWYCEGRVDVISRHPEIIGIMYNTGLRKLQIGVESGNQKVLNIYNKNITKEQMEIVVKEASKYEGLLLHGNIIMGNPKETFSEYKEGLEFIKHLIKLSNYNLDISKTYLTPYYGTPIRTSPEKYGIEMLVEDFEFSRFGMNEVVCKPDALTIDELNSLAALTDHSLQLFINDNIYKLPRKTVLKHYFQHKPKGEMPTTWIKSFTSLRTFRKYLRIVERSTTFKGETITNESTKLLSPLRLWDIEYNKHKNEYYFISLNDEKIIINDKTAFLWEKATGKKSIYEIYKESKHLKKTLALNTIIEFYQNLEDKMAIVLIDL